jgi:hypothetical protein
VKRLGSKKKNEKMKKEEGISEEICTQGRREAKMNEKKEKKSGMKKEKKKKVADIVLNPPFLKLFVTPNMIPKMYIF